MPTPRDFLQTADGDVDFSKGLRHTPDLQTYVVQKLSQTLAFWEGEWFLDTREGIPLLRTMLGKRFDKRLVESVYRAAIMQTRGVGSVRAMVTSFDNATRVLTINPIDVRCFDGTEVPNPGPFVLSV